MFKRRLHFAVYWPRPPDGFLRLLCKSQHVWCLLQFPPTQRHWKLLCWNIFSRLGDMTCEWKAQLCACETPRRGFLAPSSSLPRTGCSHSDIASKSRGRGRGRGRGSLCVRRRAVVKTVKGGIPVFLGPRENTVRYCTVLSWKYAESHRALKLRLGR